MFAQLDYWKIYIGLPFHNLDYWKYLPSCCLYNLDYGKIYLGLLEIYTLDYWKYIPWITGNVLQDAGAHG